VSSSSVPSHLSSELLITSHHLDLVAQPCIIRYPSEAWSPWLHRMLPTSQYSTTQERRTAMPNLSSSNASPSPATTTQQSSAVQDALPQFLLLSTAAAARFQNSLAQGDVTSVTKDSDFFRIVSQSYQKLQGGWLGRYLRSPKTMEYIKVRTWHNCAIRFPMFSIGYGELNWLV
jgi:hypothetical protein